MANRPLTEAEIAALPIQALLVRAGLITIDHLSEALRENVETKRAVEDIVVERGWVPAATIEELRAMKGLPPSAPTAAVPAATAAEVPAPSSPTPAPAAADTPAPPAPAAADMPATPALAPRPVAGAQFHVRLSLVGGARLNLGAFPTADDGQRYASEILEAVLRPDPGVWPQFGNRLVRPDAVVSVEVARHADD